MSTLPDRFCLQCGAKLAQDSKVCMGCGRSVPELVAAQPEQQASSAPHAAPDQFLETPPSDKLVSQNNAAPPITKAGASPQGAQTAEAAHARLDTRPYRSGCVTTLAFLVGFQALGAVVAFIANLNMGDIFGTININVLVLAIPTILLAWGLWSLRLRRWSFWAAIVLEMIYLALSLLNWWQMNLRGEEASRTLIPIFLSLMVLIGLSASSTIRAVIRSK